MASRRLFRTNLQIAVLVAANVVALWPGTAVAGPEKSATAEPREKVRDNFVGQPISRDYGSDEESGVIRAGGLTVVYGRREIEGEGSPIGTPRTAPQLTGFLKKRKLFTLVWPDDKPLLRWAGVVIARLDPSTKFPQVIFSTHSGGTYCCTFSKIATGLPS